MAYTEQYSILTGYGPAKHFGMLVGLNQVSLIITVSYSQHNNNNICVFIYKSVQIMCKSVFKENTIMTVSMLSQAR